MLEPRLLFCLNHVAGASSIPAIASSTAATEAITDGGVASNGLPLLHSLPGATASLYLDFDGYGGFQPYDSDGNPGSFDAAEQAELREAWRQVASYFSMFNLDVTTELPATGPYGYSLISNSILSATTTGSFPSTTPASLNPSIDARTRLSSLAHEAGHAFALGHQSDYDRLGRKVNEYSAGPDALHGPIMGVDFAGDVHKWVIGHPASSAIDLQDDVAIIAGRIAAYAGGDGMRADDVPGTLSLARPLSAAAAGMWSASGMVERLDDVDAYRFDAPGGPLRIDLVPPSPSMLDGKLEIYGEGGTLLAAADGPANDQHLLFPSLPAGTYYALVKSHGDYADLGPYDLTVSQTTGLPGPTPQYNNMPAPGGLTLSTGDGTSVEAEWQPVDGATGYALQRSDDGVAWTDAGTTGPDVTTYRDIGLPGGRRHFYRVSAASPSGLSAPSTAASLVNRPSPPALFPLTSSGASVVVNWRDTSGETGYRVERQAIDANGSGGAWKVVAEVGRNVPSVADSTASSAAWYRYRVIATSEVGDAAPAEVTGTLVPTVVRGLKVTGRSATQVSLAWDPIAGVQFTIERSGDGLRFEPVGETTTAHFTDSSVAQVKRYFYRVVATTDWGHTVRSGVVAVTTPSDEPLPAGWEALDIGYAAGGAAATAAAGAFRLSVADGTASVIGVGPGTLPYPLAQKDSFRFLFRHLTGDGSITTRVSWDNPIPAGSMAGIMFRDSGAADTRFSFAGLSNQYGPGFIWRESTGGYPSFAGAGSPTTRWFRIVRQGNVIRGFDSVDGSAWRLSREVLYDVPDTMLVGLAVSAGNETAQSSATFSGVEVTVTDAPSILEPPSASLSADYRSANLSVRAIDRYGDPANLTYAWSVLSGPGGTLFSDNDTHTASQVSVAFSYAGMYVFRLTVTGDGGRSSYADVPFNVPIRPMRLSITPASVTMPVGTQQEFSTEMFDQFGRLMPWNPNWSARFGHVDTKGLYTAPLWGTFDTVTADIYGLPLTATAEIYAYHAFDGPTLLSAASRKVHGRGGTLEIPVTAFGGPTTVEPRPGGPTTLRFTFSSNVFAADRVLDADDFDLAGATFRSASISGAVLTLQLSGVKDDSVVTVGFGRLVDARSKAVCGPAELKVESRFGDVDGSGAVNAADLLLLRRAASVRRSVQDPRFDLDLSGVVSAADLVLARRRLATIFA